MNFIQEYALLLAVGIPVVVIVAINVFLALGGERDTLLFPGLRSFPTGLVPAETDAPLEDQPVPIVSAANEEFDREAA